MAKKQNSFESRAKKMMRYVKAKTLADKFNLLDETRKKYVRYLVSKYGYTVKIAIQQAYLFGFDVWPYDNRTKRPTRETIDASYFGEW